MLFELRQRRLAPGRFCVGYVYTWWANDLTIVREKTLNWTRS